MKLVIENDRFPESPRNWDNLGTMFTMHRHYDFSDEGAKNVNPKTFNGVILPVYMYDHSGIRLSTNPFECKWDSGQLGVIYCEADKIRKEFNCKRITKKIRVKVEEILKAEIEVLDDYVTGNVWGYTLYDDNGEHKDSCWGFFGDPDDNMQKMILNDCGADPNTEVEVKY